MAVYTTIDDPSLYFRVKTYSGSSSDGNAITWDETDTNMSPNFLWLKNRTSAQEHWLCDTVRGTGKFLESNSSNAESSDGASGFASFDSNGFTLNDSARTNRNTMVAWGWKETADAGFDIVSYTGNAVDGRTISHSLSAVPDMYIIKNRSATEPWMVYHGTLGNTNAMYLNTTMASTASNGYTNDTSPTSSVFSVSDWEGNNGDGNSLIAYLFTAKQGFSKFGSYTGNGNADGTFVYTGFRPAFVMCRDTANAAGWHIFDNKRSNSFNEITVRLEADNSDAENDSGPPDLDFLSNGFKFRTSFDNINRSGTTHIYMAFAEAPFVNSNGVPCNAR